MTFNYNSIGNRALLEARKNAALARESGIEGTLKQRRQGRMKFNPDSEYIQSAMLDFF